jgi:hypothetical protein
MKTELAERFYVFLLKIDIYYHVLKDPILGLNLTQLNRLINLSKLI